MISDRLWGWKWVALAMVAMLVRGTVGLICGEADPCSQDQMHPRFQWTVIPDAFFDEAAPATAGSEGETTPGADGKPFAPRPCRFNCAHYLSISSCFVAANSPARRR